MPLYSVADGYNVALVSLTAVTPQPAGDPVAPVARTTAVSGAIHEQGLFCAWRWSVIKDETAYLALLTQFGLHNAETNEVTIYTRNQRLQWARYNALVTYPEPLADMRWERAFARGITLNFTKLVAL